MSAAKPTRVRQTLRASPAPAHLPQPDGHADAPDVASTAEYVASMAAELADIAGAARLDMLTYFLNMARIEAESHCSRRK